MKKSPQGLDKLVTNNKVMDQCGANKRFMLELGHQIGVANKREQNHCFLGWCQ